MIERHVYLKFKDGFANDATRAEFVAETKRILPKIPGVVDVSVGTPADSESLAAWDAFLTVRFRRIEDVQPYIVHPDHQGYVKTVLEPRVQVKKAWNLRMAD